MSQPHPFQVLQEIGLPEKAATIYLSLLSNRRMTVASLARESGIKRPTCYEYIGFLLAKGFILREPVGKRMFYSAVRPTKVLSDFKKKAALLEASVEEMAKMQDEATSKARVVFYEGKREIRSIYEDLFKTVGDVYSIFPAAAFFENFSVQDYEDFDKEISGYALKSRDLFVADKYYKKIKEIRAKNGSENKLDKKLPPWFTCNVDVLIYSDKVALMSLRDLSAIVIENKDIAELFKNIHSFMWKSV
jgi:sugar-specific transcriptional regulator TrmB